MNLSLAADSDTAIEPFNLNEERYGGGGYFDATGNYVFRSGNVNPDDTDAWLDGLGEGKDMTKSVYDKKEEKEEEEEGREEVSFKKKIAALIRAYSVNPRGAKRRVNLDCS